MSHENLVDMFDDHIAEKRPLNFARVSPVTIDDDVTKFFEDAIHVAWMPQGDSGCYIARVYIPSVARALDFRSEEVQEILGLEEPGYEGSYFIHLKEDPRVQGINLIKGQPRAAVQVTMMFSTTGDLLRLDVSEVIVVVAQNFCTDVADSAMDRGTMQVLTKGQELVNILRAKNDQPESTHSMAMVGDLMNLTSMALTTWCSVRDIKLVYRKESSAWASFTAPVRRSSSLLNMYQLQAYLSNAPLPMTAGFVQKYLNPRRQEDGCTWR